MREIDRAVLAQVVRNKISLVVTSVPIFSCAFSVLPPMCGVRITFGSSCSTVSKTSALVLGCSREDIDCCPAEAPLLQRMSERTNVDNRAWIHKTALDSFVILLASFMTGRNLHRFRVQPRAADLPVDVETGIDQGRLGNAAHAFERADHVRFLTAKI